MHLATHTVNICSTFPRNPLAAKLPVYVAAVNNMVDPKSNIRYKINAADEIVEVGGGWDMFAIENDSPPELSSGSIIYRRFWDFVSGNTIEHVYRRMFSKVRAGETLDFSFRCDSPSLRRFLVLQMKPLGDGGIEIVTETVCTEEREFQELFSINAPKAGEVVVACSWCNKIKTGENVWQEAEDAVSELGLFEKDILPPLSHGMCDDCYKAVMGTME